MKLSWRPVLAQWPIYLLLTTYTVGMFMGLIQGPFLLQAKGISAPSVLGMVMAAASVVGALSGALYGLMRRFLGFREMFIVLSLAFGIGLPLAAWAPTAGFYVLAMVVVGLGAGLLEPTIASQLLLRTPEPLH